MAVLDVHPRLYAAVFERLAYFGAEHFQTLGLGAPVALDKTHQLVVLPGAAEAETKILQLCLDMVQAEAVRQRGVEIVGFAGYLHLLVGAHARQGTHIVQTVGELHQNRANAVLHGVEHLLEVVELPRHFVLFFFCFVTTLTRNATSSPKRCLMSSIV